MANFNNIEKPAFNSWPVREDADDYLQKHKILELFGGIVSQLVFNRPENPKDFMIQYLENLIKARVTSLDHPCLFDQANLRSIFGMLDPNGSGRISAPQYQHAMRSLGITDFNEWPPGAKEDKVSLETFIMMAFVISRLIGFSSIFLLFYILDRKGSAQRRQLIKNYKSISRSNKNV